MQQMEAEGLEMDEESLAALLLSYANAEPQQNQLAEQVFKQQMFRGKTQATRKVLQSLRAAVGGARCLELRREMKLVDDDDKNARKQKGDRRPRLRGVPSNTLRPHWKSPTTKYKMLVGAGERM